VRACFAANRLSLCAASASRTLNAPPPAPRAQRFAPRGLVRACFAPNRLSLCAAAALVPKALRRPTHERVFLWFSAGCCDRLSLCAATASRPRPYPRPRRAHHGSYTAGLVRECFACNRRTLRAATKTLLQAFRCLAPCAPPFVPRGQLRECFVCKTPLASSRLGLRAREHSAAALRALRFVPNVRCAKAEACKSPAPHWVGLHNFQRALGLARECSCRNAFADRQSRRHHVAYDRNAR